MKISKKRINSIGKYLRNVKENEPFHIVIPVDGKQQTIEKLGLMKGNSVLPHPSNGKASEYNSEGRVIVRKDLPMEGYTQELPWELEDRGGYLHTGVNYIERERYPRDFVNPLEVYIQLGTVDSVKCVMSDELINNVENYDKIKNTINMFLEIFGESHVATGSYSFITNVKLNWRVLPPGENPWETLKANIERHYPQGSTNRSLYTNRIDFLNQFNPNFIAEGVNGFDGYFILGYEQLGIYVAENINYGNATYFFDSEWQVLSKLSKAVIINGDLAVERVIHGKTRKSKVKALLTAQQNISLLTKISANVSKT